MMTILTDGRTSSIHNSTVKSITTELGELITCLDVPEAHQNTPLAENPVTITPQLRGIITRLLTETRSKIGDVRDARAARQGGGNI